MDEINLWIEAFQEFDLFYSGVVEGKEITSNDIEKLETFLFLIGRFASKSGVIDLMECYHKFAENSVAEIE